MASKVRGEAAPVGDKGPPKKIRRVKTGCSTCRRRRKKCDEGRPDCNNCRSIGVECPGYPEKKRWETTPVGRKALASKGISLDRELAFVQPILQHPSPASSFDFNESICSDWDMLSISPASRFAVLDSYAPQYIEYNYENCVLYPLPCLISGIETNLQRELYQHFTEVTSRILTKTNNDTNPFREAVILRALGDRTVMVALLSLAGAHLMQVIPQGAREDIALETSQLHKEAVHTQSSSLAILRSMHQNSDASMVQYQEHIFTIFLLLCMYETCQGSKDNSSIAYLDKAREVLTMGSPVEMGQGDGRETISTGINQHLLEFFLYHDSLVSVTFQSHGAPKPRIRCLAVSPHEPSLIDLLRSFRDFTVDISLLRSRSISSDGNSVAAVSSIGLNIEQDLKIWRPKVPIQSTQIAGLYRVSLFLWLKSIIAPSQLQDTKIRDLISENIIRISEITQHGGPLPLLLFPLFILGAVCTSAPDRLIITTLFQKLRNWSNFGNINNTEGLVRLMWQNHDRGLPRSWDWVGQLETQNMSLLVS